MRKSYVNAIKKRLAKLESKIYEIDDFVMKASYNSNLTATSHIKLISKIVRLQSDYLFFFDLLKKASPEEISDFRSFAENVRRSLNEMKSGINTIP